MVRPGSVGTGVGGRGTTGDEGVEEETRQEGCEAVGWRLARPRVMEGLGVGILAPILGASWRFQGRVLVSVCLI